MIKCTSHLFDENHQMIKEIFNAYAGLNGQCFTLNPNDDLPNEAELVISKSKQIVYIAWKLDHCIALEVVSKNANEDKYGDTSSSFPNSPAKNRPTVFP